MSDPVIKAQRTNRARMQDELQSIIARAEAAGNRSLTAAEDLEFSRLSTSIKELDARIASRKTEQKRHRSSMRNSVVMSAAGDGVRSSPMTYAPLSPHSYLMDLATISTRTLGGGVGDGVDAAAERMSQHLKELTIEARSGKVRRLLTESKFGNAANFEFRVNPNTTAGTGGEFVPPLWLVS